MKFTSVEEMHRYGLVSKADVGTYLSRVCCFWVRSGSWYVMLFLCCVCCISALFTSCAHYIISFLPRCYF